MFWSAAISLAERLADAGFDTTIYVDARPDAATHRNATVRVARASITDSKLKALYEDALEAGLEFEVVEVDAAGVEAVGKYVVLS